MATQKKAWLSAIATIALVAILGLTFAFKDAHSSKAEGNKVFANWYFIGTTTADITDGTKWQTTNPNNPSCSTANLPLPCQLNVPATVTNASELDDYFTDEYGDDGSVIVAAAPSRRPLP